MQKARIVIFEKDEPTGAKSVIDIRDLEIPVDPKKRSKAIGDLLEPYLAAPVSRATKVSSIEITLL